MKSVTYWAVVPAAGRGVRMGTECPKQYLPLQGKTVMQHSLERLCAHEKIAGVVVALAVHDKHGKELLRAVADHGKQLISVAGGAQRAHSVLNGLRRLAKFAHADDWVLVHDVVRPCLRHADIDKLIDGMANHPHGGLLGLRAHDTIKRVSPVGEVVETLSRNEIWRAQTPQMFRLGALTEALTRAIERQLDITDEAAAMALTGIVPIMVEGHVDNIKITHKSDLALAKFYMEQQEIAS